MKVITNYCSLCTLSTNFDLHNFSTYNYKQKECCPSKQRNISKKGVAIIYIQWTMLSLLAPSLNRLGFGRFPPSSVGKLPGVNLNKPITIKGLFPFRNNIQFLSCVHTQRNTTECDTHRLQSYLCLFVSFSMVFTAK